MAEIPLTGTYMDLEMNVGGRFDGTFHLDATGYDNDTLVSATIPGRSFIAVERNEKCIWCGYVWSRTYQSQAKSVQLYGQSFEYYPAHQLIRSDTSYTGIEQLEIFKSLWNQMQAVPGRNMNINVPSVVAPTLVGKNVDILATDFKYYSEIMSSLADGDNGFDWTIDVTKSGNQYVKTLRYVYPVMGATDSGLTSFEYPGSILNYYATESMADAGTNVFTLGSGSGSEMLVSEFVHQSLLDSGFPRWDFVVAAKDINDRDALDAIGAGEGGIARPPRLTVKPSFKAEETPAFGDWGMGDACRLIIKDSRFPTGINFDTRVVKWALQPQSSENSDEYTLVFAGDEENA